MAQKRTAKSYLQLPRLLTTDRKKRREAERKLKAAERLYQKGLARIATPSQRRALKRLQGFELAEFIQAAKLGSRLRALNKALVREAGETLYRLARSQTAEARRPR